MSELKKSEKIVLRTLATLAHTPISASFTALQKNANLSERALSMALKNLVDKGLINRELIRKFPRKVVYFLRIEIQSLIRRLYESPSKVWLLDDLLIASDTPRALWDIWCKRLEEAGLIRYREETFWLKPYICVWRGDMSDEDVGSFLNMYKAIARGVEPVMTGSMSDLIFHIVNMMYSLNPNVNFKVVRPVHYGKNAPYAFIIMDFPLPPPLEDQPVSLLFCIWDRLISEKEVDAFFKQIKEINVEKIILPFHPHRTIYIFIAEEFTEEARKRAQSYGIITKTIAQFLPTGK